MRVGSTVNYGDNNAANLAQANLALNANAILEVSSGDRIDTFNNLTLSGGSVRFDGTAGFNAGNDLADLHIDGTLTLGSGNIALTLPDQSADMTGSLGHDSLLSTASSGLFETLIEAEKGIVGDISNITLNMVAVRAIQVSRILRARLAGVVKVTLRTVSLITALQRAETRSALISSSPKSISFVAKRLFLRETERSVLL